MDALQSAELRGIDQKDDAGSPVRNWICRGLRFILAYFAEVSPAAPCILRMPNHAPLSAVACHTGSLRPGLRCRCAARAAADGFRLAVSKWRPQRGRHVARLSRGQ